jgi:RNA polymerase sigma-32 factor
LPMGDLIQEGNVGLMKAVKRFDPAINVRLVSFAVHWVRAEIHEYVLRNWRLVKVATTKAQRKLFFNLRRMKKNLTWLSHEETAAVARDLGVTAAEVTEMEQRLSARDMSFDPTPDTEDEDVAYSPASYLPAPAADPAEAVEAEEWDGVTNANLQAALARLDARSRDILLSRWTSDGKSTLHELADRHKVSAERMGQPASIFIASGHGIHPRRLPTLTIRHREAGGAWVRILTLRGRIVADDGDRLRAPATCHSVAVR